MRLVIISDTHGSHRKIALPDGDTLIQAGDFTRHGSIEEPALVAITTCSRLPPLLTLRLETLALVSQVLTISLICLARQDVYSFSFQFLP
jgi:hypothetical protein